MLILDTLVSRGSCSKSVLSIKWCGQAIKRHEERHGVRFDVVAFTRPDLLRSVALRYVTLSSERHTLVPHSPSHP